MIDIKKAQSLPVKVIFQNVAVYVLPVLIFITQILITGTVAPEKRLEYFFSPLFIIYVILSVICPLGIIAGCGYFIKKNLQIADAVDVVNRISVIFLRLTIVGPAILGFTLPILAYDHHGETVFHAIAGFLQVYGSIALGGLLGFVFFQPSFENFLSFVPFLSSFLRKLCFFRGKIKVQL